MMGADCSHVLSRFVKSVYLYANNTTLLPSTSYIADPIRPILHMNTEAYNLFAFPTSDTWPTAVFTCMLFMAYQLLAQHVYGWSYCPDKQTCVINVYIFVVMLTWSMGLTPQRKTLGLTAPRNGFTVNPVGWPWHSTC